MGIEGLPKLIREVAGKQAIDTKIFSDFKGMTIAVDASLMIYQIVIASRSSGRDMTNLEGKLTSHLNGMLFKILILLENQICPIFVFDGKPPKIKNKSLLKRREIKERAEKNMEGLDEKSEEYIKNFKKTFRPSRDDIIEAQTLLDLMGIPYIVAPGEADVLCSWLASRKDANGNRYAKGVCSDDSDMLALGADYLFKNMLKSMNKNNSTIVINLKKTLARMKLTMSQFVDMCVLLGCDGCNRIKGIGPKTAYRFILKYGTLENVLKFIKKNFPNELTEEHRETLIDSRNYFRDAVKEVDKMNDFILTDDQLKLRTFQYNELMDFLCVKHNFDPIRIQKAVSRLKKAYDIMNVSRPNGKKVHVIIKPVPENHNFSDIEFLSSSAEGPASKKHPLKDDTDKRA